MRSTLASIALAVLLCAHAAAGASTRPPRDAFSRSSVKSLTLRAWGPLDKGTSGDAIILDPTTTSASQIGELKSKGKTVICYMSAGTLENYRKDKSALDDSTAKKYKGFGGTETWLDITQWKDLKGPMADRIDLAASKGCMGMELDNIDCFQNMCVRGHSYDELKDYQVQYIKWLIDEVQSHGMKAGLKNVISLFDEVADKADFAINEECMSWSECGSYSRFTSKGKVVFNVEYNSHGGKVCEIAKKNGMVTMYKDGGSWKNCW